MRIVDAAGVVIGLLALAVAWQTRVWSVAFLPFVAARLLVVGRQGRSGVEDLRMRLAGQQDVDSIDPNEAAIMQQAAWEAVAKWSHMVAVVAVMLALVAALFFWFEAYSLIKCGVGACER